MATITWCPKRRILCGFQGDQAVVKFDYSVFENIERGLVTPSMYNWMTSWIQGTISVEQLDALVQGDQFLFQTYTEDAHREYHNLPWQERLEHHTQTVENLKSELRCIELDENQLRDADNPFSYSSSLFDAYEVWAREQGDALSKLAMQIADELDEEALWEQGGEDGASQTDGPTYDHMDEV
jgi:hypothetical protein